MAIKSVKQMQTALMAAGYDIDPLGADGDFSRDTIAAIKAFQRTKGLQGSGAIGPKTLALLFPGEHSSIDATPPWYANFMLKQGLHEKLDNDELKRYLKSDHQSLEDPAKQPWCGDAVQTAIALTLPDKILPSNPYWALNWAKFGVALDEPALGAILVFSKDGGGHVGFYSREDKTRCCVLSRNKANGISIAPVKESQLKAKRWPKSAPFFRGESVHISSVDEALTSVGMG